jgi:predicted ATP-binding protein involved in virulence
MTKAPKPAYIRRIQISKLWGTHDFDMDCHEDVNILYGENGTGKSTVLRLLGNKLSNTLVSQKYIEYDRLEIVESDGSKDTEVNMQKASKQVSGGRADNVLVGTNVFYLNTFDFTADDLNGKSTIDYALEGAIRRYLVYTNDLSARVFSKESTFEKAFAQKEYLFSTINQLFAPTEKVIDASTSDLRFILPNQKKIMVDALSSGEKQILVLLLTVICQDNKPSILLLDEPEISLHLRWQHRLIEILRTLNPHCQLFIATHSPSIFNDGYRDHVFFMEDCMRKPEPAK